MPIGYVNNKFSRLFVGFLLVALLVPSFGSLNLVRAEDQNTSSTESGTPTSTIIDNTNDESASSTQTSNSTGTTQTSSSTEDLIQDENESSTSETDETSSPGVPEPPQPPDATVINTGNAAAFANLLNVVNTNIIDSKTFFAFLNYINGNQGDIVVPWGENGLDGCDSGCLQGDINVENDNDANVQNDVVVAANTGENNIIGNHGTSVIVTGNAAAAANIGNIVNTNIVNSNYLLLAINSFSHLNGSLILPPSSFFNNKNSGVTTQQLAIENNNDADVENNVSTTAKTGDNEIASDGNGGTIITGNSNALANVHNSINTNLVNTGKMFILVRVAGDWAGDVFSAPPGMSWIQTPQGILLFSDDETQPSDCNTCGGSVNVANNNGASVKNNVEVYALTGDNKIETEGDEEDQSAIVTGHAAAAANVYNMVNSNVIGTNYLFAMINVFGNWNGNLSFGQPDLWVGARAETVSDPSSAGDTIKYVIDVINRGNTAATQVKVKSAAQNPSLFSLFGLSGNGGIKNDGSVEWNIPSLAPGASTRFTYHARVGNNLPGGLTLTSNQISVQAHEPESDNSNNIESLSLALQGSPIIVGRPGGAGSGTPMIFLEKTNNATSSTVSPSSTIRYSLTLKNLGNASTFDTILTDVLRDPYGRVIARNAWDLGIVYPSEKITIEYDVNFSEFAGSGYYINYASLSATNDYYQAVANLPKASSSIYVVNPDDQPKPVVPNPVVYVGGGSSSGGNSSSEEESNNEENNGGGSLAPEPKEEPTPPSVPTLPEISEDQLYSGEGEEIIENSGVQFIGDFEPVREKTTEESLLQATTSFLRSQLLASFSFLPSGAWAFFLLLLLLIAIVARSLLSKDQG